MAKRKRNPEDGSVPVPKLADYAPAAKLETLLASDAVADFTAPDETREDKLRRIAGRRVNNALQAIRLVGNLASYKPTPQQVNAIMNALTAAVSEVRNRLTAPANAKQRDLFKL